MPRRKKILIYSPPFNGHLYILRSLMLKYKKQYDFKIIITGWKNIPTDTHKIRSKTKILGKSNLNETDPAIWTFKRVYELLGDCLTETKKYKPDLIIYDFFSLEAYFCGKILNIPTWCSIPAMIGPNLNKKYLKEKLSLTENKKFIKKIKDKYGIDCDQEKIEMISDGLHIGTKVNLVWSYPSLIPDNFMSNRKKTQYVFIGNLRANKRKKKLKHKKHVIYFSLGTVVMNNLWNQQKKTRQQLIKFITLMTKLWGNNEYQVRFVSQGKKILNKYPDNWKIINYADQIKELKHADIFITHGGSNSFHEAVKLGVPMVTIPFFGDQILVGQQTQRLEIGINPVNNKNIDTKKNKNFLDLDLAKKLDRSVEKILNNIKYQKNINKLKLRSTPINKLIDKIK